MAPAVISPSLAVAHFSLTHTNSHHLPSPHRAGCDPKMSNISLKLNEPVNRQAECLLVLETLSLASLFRGPGGKVAQTQTLILKVATYMSISCLKKHTSYNSSGEKVFKQSTAIQITGILMHLFQSILVSIATARPGRCITDTHIHKPVNK